MALRRGSFQLLGCICPSRPAEFDGHIPEHNPVMPWLVIPACRPLGREADQRFTSDGVVADGGAETHSQRLYRIKI
jgi:hypothetical protein